MSTPPEIDDLASKIASAHPYVRVKIEAPLMAGGAHYIDARLGEHLVVVEWDQSHGYGITLITKATLDTGRYIRVKTLDEALEQVAARLRSVTCGILDESGTFACHKAWGHDEPTHAGVLRSADGGSHGKSWIADDEEHLRRLTIKEKS